jgi:HNH endonuclease
MTEIEQELLSAAGQLAATFASVAIDACKDPAVVRLFTEVPPGAYRSAVIIEMNARVHDSSCPRGPRIPAAHGLVLARASGGTLMAGWKGSTSKGSTRRWRAMRAEQLRRHPICEFCHRARAVEVDHVVPRSQGGDDTRLQALCHSCHARKTAADKMGRLIRGCDANGRPLDRRHHWWTARGE